MFSEKGITETPACFTTWEEYGCHDRVVLCCFLDQRQYTHKDYQQPNDLLLPDKHPFLPLQKSDLAAQSQQ